MINLKSHDVTNPLPKPVRIQFRIDPGLEPDSVPGFRKKSASLHPVTDEARVAQERPEQQRRRERKRQRDAEIESLDRPDHDDPESGPGLGAGGQVSLPRLQVGLLRGLGVAN